MPAGSPLLFLTHYLCAVDDLPEYCTKSILSLFQIPLLLCTAFSLEEVSVSAAVVWENYSWNVFAGKICQLAQPESVARIIIVTVIEHSSIDRGDITASGTDLIASCHLPTFISLTCFWLTWRIMQMGFHTVLSPSQASRGAGRRLSSKTCPPSQTKKHSLPQHHGTNTRG